jgi:outer membrane protein OmpA-like peptidoglycan-associated protein
MGLSGTPLADLPVTIPICQRDDQIGDEVMHNERVSRLLVKMTVLVIAFLVLAAQQCIGQSSASTQPELSQHLKDVLFDFDTHESPKDVEVLRADAEWLKANPQVRFYLEGYTDAKGSIIYNLVLAQRRTDTVKKSLIDMGITPDRIVFATGWGELYQICQEQTEECWHRNRRVVFEYAGE